MSGEREPREFALQLAAVAERLDARSVRAVERVESAAAALEREAAAARDGLAAERVRFATALDTEAHARIRWLRATAFALFAGAIVAVAGAALAVSSARRELAAVARDDALLRAVNAADIAVCGRHLCARVEADGSAAESGGYRRVAPR